MKQLKVFIKKEFLHVLRDRKTLLILFGMPVVQIMLFGFALTNEVRDSRIAVVDYAHDVTSSQLTAKIAASRYFIVQEEIRSHEEVEAAFKKGIIKAAVIFPGDLSGTVAHNGYGQVQIIADATDINTASQVTGYLNAVINDYNQTASVNMQNSVRILPETRMLFNPQLKGAPNFVPGVMAMVLLLVCVMMTAVAIVKEKETGTMEVLLVSPVQPAFIIIAKAVPYLILSLINLTAILLLSVYVLDVPVKGDLLLLVTASTIFILACLSLGILISIQTDSQQVAMLISLVGMLMPTMMLSGFMFPVENMPKALQIISNIVPSKWYYIIVKQVMIKGAGLRAVWKEMTVLMAYTLFLFMVSMKRFKIRLQ